MKVYSLMVLASIFCNCTENNPVYKSPPGYDLNHPVVYNMHKSLIEISGIAFDNSNNDTVFAEQDEEGAVYMLHLNNKMKYLGKSVFRTHGDFEDITICNNQVIMLQSDGTMFIFPLNEVDSKKINSVQKWEGLLPPGEYESIYANDQSNKVYVLCKNCKIDRQSGFNQISGYIFTLGSSGLLQFAGNFNIQSKEIARHAGVPSIRFKSSAITYNKWTSEWYILSSVNKMLVITNDKWRVKNVYHLDPRLYIQPEGITFDNRRNLYISSEGSKIKPGTISKIFYHLEK